MTVKEEQAAGTFFLLTEVSDLTKLLYSAAKRRYENGIQAPLHIEPQSSKLR